MKFNMIDVATYQGNIDWLKVKQTGIDVAIIKASQGGSASSNDTINPFVDPCFKRNIEGAINNGIKGIGVYHYLAGTTVYEVKQEAKFLLKLIEPYKTSINTFVAVDVEDMSTYPKYQKLGADINTELVQTFCNEVKREGYKPVLYSNKSFLINCFNHEKIEKDNIDIWYARWGVDEDIAKNEEPEMIAWQFGSCFVNGIQGAVDANCYYGVFEEDDDMIRWKTVNDVPEGYYRNQVKRLMNDGIIVGKDDGTIDLTEDMLRGILMGERFIPRWKTIDDVPHGYYRNQVRRLVDSGVIVGKEDGSIDLTEDMLRTILIAERVE